ncbi:hypothetical protein Bhyg_06417, partial [Pseudolycoriella hygida]
MVFNGKFKRKVLCGLIVYFVYLNQVDRILLKETEKMKWITILTIVAIVFYFDTVAEAKIKIANGQCYENRECFNWCTEFYGYTVGTCDYYHNCMCAGGHRDQNGVVSLVQGVHHWISDKLEERRRNNAREDYNQGGRQAQDWYCGDVYEKSCTGTYS